MTVDSGQETSELPGLSTGRRATAIAGVIAAILATVFGLGDLASQGWNTHSWIYTPAAAAMFVLAWTAGRVSPPAPDDDGPQPE